MTTSLTAYLDQQTTALGRAVAARLRSERDSVFELEGEAAVEQVVLRLLAALRSDLDAGGVEHLRRALRASCREELTRPPGHHDLCLLTRALRAALLDGLEPIEDLAPRSIRLVEGWLSELALEAGLTLVRERDQRIEQQSCEIELRMAEAKAHLEEKSHLAEQLANVISTVPGMVWQVRYAPAPGKGVASFVSDYILPMLGYTPDAWLEEPNFWLDIMPPEDRSSAREEAARIRAQGGGTQHFRWITKDGRLIWVESHMAVIRNANGEPIGLTGVTMDITARKHAEEARARLQEELIELQSRQLTELSTPLIPLSGEVLVMPLIGGIDRARAEGVISTLLTGIARSRAKIAILDVTGVPRVDAETADALLRTARCVQLLGAEVVLTGIRPEVARTLVELGADLGRVPTLGTLQDGIAYAMGRAR